VQPQFPYVRRLGAHQEPIYPRDPNTAHMQNPYINSAPQQRNYYIPDPWDARSAIISDWGDVENEQDRQHHRSHPVRKTRAEAGSAPNRPVNDVEAGSSHITVRRRDGTLEMQRRNPRSLKKRETFDSTMSSSRRQK